MMADFHFLRPAWLLLLPVLFALVWWAMRTRGRGGVWSRVVDAALLPFIVQGGAVNMKSRAGWLLAGAGALAVLAQAGPVWERQPVPVFRTEGALVIALDLSASMNSADIKPSRLERAKFKVADILHARKTGQTALLVFAAQAFVVTPLTNDVQTLLAHLSVLDPSIMPSQGSEPAAALELAAKLLNQGGLPNGHVLLVTDGAEEAGMARARELARAGTFNVSVLGMGTTDGAPVPDVNGDFIKGANGALVMSHLDIVGLKALARDGNGIYLDSRADDGDVTALSRYLDDDRAAHAERLEKLATSQWNEMGPWLLLPLLPLAALAFRRGVLVLLAAVALGGAVPRDAHADWWRTPDQAGQQAFEQKDYAGAAQRFEDPAWRAAARYRAGDFAGASEDLKGSDTALGHYNRGNALARQGQLAEALAAYDAALKSDPNNADAKFNRELVAKALEAQKKEQQEQQGGQQNKQSKQSEGDKSEQQQSGGEKDGQSQADSSAATNAGGGERSKDKTHNEQASEDANANGSARKQAEQAQLKQDDDKKDGDDKAARAKPDDKPAGADAERKQATEQWLGQIRDEPATLLKRKFKYQYEQIYGGKSSETNPW
ncbi:MAG: VWA domain-containing protein [Gammaproteobacteria bacterium]|nr:VWA domain-containing protein [Gammaproteobacteria bacterium]